MYLQPFLGLEMTCRMQQVVDIRPDGQWEFRSDAVEYVLCHTRDSYAFFMAKSKVAQ